MSGRDWKPGEVAMVHTREFGEQVGIRTSADVQEFFHVAGFSVATDKQVRPLVVIDPEDREAAERLALDISRHEHVGCLSLTCFTDRTQAALREYANPSPPKPDEPTSFGALVLDVDGVAWSRRADRAGMWNGQNGDIRQWQDIDAARVLSEGVQS